MQGIPQNPCISDKPLLEGNMPNHGCPHQQTLTNPCYKSSKHQSFLFEGSEHRFLYQLEGFPLYQYTYGPL